MLWASVDPRHARDVRSVSEGPSATVARLVAFRSFLRNPRNRKFQCNCAVRLSAENTRNNENDERSNATTRRSVVKRKSRGLPVTPHACHSAQRWEGPVVNSTHTHHTYIHKNRASFRVHRRQSRAQTRRATSKDQRLIDIGDWLDLLLPVIREEKLSRSIDSPIQKSTTTIWTVIATGLLRFLENPLLFTAKEL